MNQHLNNDSTSQAGDSTNPQHSILSRKNGSAGATFLDSDVNRYLLGWFLSLSLVTLAFNMPYYGSPTHIGWTSSQPSEQIVLLPMPPEEKKAVQPDGSPITVFVQPEDNQEIVPEKDEVEDEPATLPEPQHQMVKLERLDRNPVLEFAEENPSIVGGLSNLYLNIDYPKAARDQGIEGLTVLMFIVEKDGSTTDIEVFKSLHPSLDSSAVAAVRRTLFKPGRQDGKIVRVRMRLPVRFRLVTPGSKQPKKLAPRAIGN